MKAHIFLIKNPKFQLQTLCSFEDITKSVKLNGIPKNNFLCIFIIASSPGVHTFFCLWRVNQKLPQGETSQNAFRGQGQSIKVKNMHVKMGISTFKHKKRKKKKSCLVVLHHPPLIFENWKKDFTAQSIPHLIFWIPKKKFFLFFFLCEFWSFKNIFK